MNVIICTHSHPVVVLVHCSRIQSKQQLVSGATSHTITIILNVPFKLAKHLQEWMLAGMSDWNWKLVCADILQWIPLLASDLTFSIPDGNG